MHCQSNTMPFRVCAIKRCLIMSQCCGFALFEFNLLFCYDFSYCVFSFLFTLFVISSFGHMEADIYVFFPKPPCCQPTFVLFKCSTELLFGAHAVRLKFSANEQWIWMWASWKCCEASFGLKHAKLYHTQFKWMLWFWVGWCTTVASVGALLFLHFGT